MSHFCLLPNFTICYCPSLIPLLAQPKVGQVPKGVPRLHTHTHTLLEGQSCSSQPAPGVWRRRPFLLEDEGQAASTVEQHPETLDSPAPATCLATSLQAAQIQALTPRTRSRQPWLTGGSLGTSC